MNKIGKDIEIYISDYYMYSEIFNILFEKLKLNVFSNSNEANLFNRIHPTNSYKGVSLPLKISKIVLQDFIESYAESETECSLSEYSLKSAKNRITRFCNHFLLKLDFSEIEDRVDMKIHRHIHDVSWVKALKEGVFYEVDYDKHSIDGHTEFKKAIIITYAIDGYVYYKNISNEDIISVASVRHCEYSVFSEEQIKYQERIERRQKITRDWTEEKGESFLFMRTNYSLPRSKRPNLDQIENRKTRVDRYSFGIYRRF